MRVRTFAVVLPEMPYLADHTIAGKAIVPAVDLLNVLVQVLDQESVPLGKVLTMGNASFPRFLPADELARCTFEVAVHDSNDSSTGGVRATFSSRIQLPGGMQRQRLHAEVTFESQAQPMTIPPTEADADCEVSAERVYRELIPFGPQFRNLQGTIRLARTGAWATVNSPTPPHPNPSRAGCPYLLDSAMHLACLWGQRYAGMVAYPTGFSTRTLWAPVSHGKRRCIAVPRSTLPRQLVLDLWLVDDEGKVCDAIGGLLMAPLAAGPPPPAWIVGAAS